MLEYKNINSRILITLIPEPSLGGNGSSPGKNSFSNKEGTGVGSNGIMFTSLNDEPQSNCTCSRFGLTCATVLAGCLGTRTIDDRGMKYASLNPLGFVDRVLPGISQVCDYDLCKKLFDDICDN